MKLLAVALLCGCPSIMSTDPGPMPVQPYERTQPSVKPPADAVVFAVAMPFCYDDTRAILDGACSDTALDCSKLRGKAVVATFVDLAEAMKKSMGIKDDSSSEFQRVKESAIRSAEEEWSACTLHTSVGCVFGRAVLSGVDLRVCSPTMRGCQALLREASTNPDLTLTQSACVIVRVRP